MGQITEINEKGQEYTIMCKCQMNEDFNCPHCNGNMIDIEGCYICRECEFID